MSVAGRDKEAEKMLDGPGPTGRGAGVAAGGGHAAKWGVPGECCRSRGTLPPSVQGMGLPCKVCSNFFVMFLHPPLSPIQVRMTIVLCFLS